MRVKSFFVTLEEIAGFLYIKAVWEIEDFLGYGLETVLNSLFCHNLHQRTPDDEPPAVFVTHHRVLRYNKILRQPNNSLVLTSLIVQHESFLYASTTSCIDMRYILSRLPLRGVRLPFVQLSSWNSWQNVS